jgi:Cu/Ag efflux protein CusF
MSIPLLAGLLWHASALAQEPGTAKPTPIIGTITAVDPAAHTVTVKQDKTGTDYIVQVGATKTLLKVEPTAKDLKNATRITAEDLAVGDRIQVGALKSESDPNTLMARSVILMSARDLQKVHQEEAAAWQHSTPGVVSGVDPAAKTITVSARTSEGLKTITVNASAAQFTRYSPDDPKVAVPSQFADVQPGDQIRIIGQAGPDGSTMTASKIYTSSFRTVVGTVSSIAADGKQITIKDLQTKQLVTVSLNDDSSVRKLPPMMAYMLARKFNPDFKMPQNALQGEQPGPGQARQGNFAGTPPEGAKTGEAPARQGGNWRGAQGEGGNRNGGQGQGPSGSGGMRSGDLSQMLDRLPKISATDLKNGDAVIVSGTPLGSDKSHLLATNVIAGVEPIFQSAPRRQAQTLNDWGAAFGGGTAADTGMPGGSGPPQ